MLALSVAKGDFLAAETCAEFFTPLYIRVLTLLKEGKKTSGDPELDAVIERVFFRGESAEEEGSALEQELAKEYFKKRREALTKEIRLAESRGDQKEVEKTLKELQEIPNAA